MNYIKLAGRIIKKVMLWGALAALSVLLFILWSNYRISAASENKTFDSIKEIPFNKVGLVLGTSKYLRNKRINPYFKYRIQATAQLYKAKKIKYVLVSGDNGTKEYDEPSAFKDALIAQGVPAKRIFLDYAGFRTLDSVVRAKKVFGQSSLTIISQKFHNERAIFLAEKHDIAAVGFNAKDLRPSVSKNVRKRERLARVKANIDILFGVKPKFLGKAISIP